MDEQQTEPTEIEKQRDEYLAGWKRAQADYLNLKKETEREKSEFSKFANERMLEELLPVVDHFNAAIAAAPDMKEHENWLKGLRAVQLALETALKSLGVEKVRTTGPFDPNFHEAVGEDAKDGIAPGEILVTYQTGWKLNGKLLRPAKVIIAK